jgi:glycosyltransferase involved in cell wall biosynthesis
MQPPLRICMVGPSLDILGGQAVQLERLRAGMAGVGEIDVATLVVNPRLPGLLRTLQRVKYLRTVATESAYLLALIARIRHFDLIHVFSASYFSFVLAPTPAILISKLLRKKVVLNYRSGEANDHLKRWRRSALPIVRLADQVVVPSGYLVEVFREVGVPAVPIPNIVDVERFRFRVRRPLRPVFFANRNLEPLYNVGCVLRAFGRIQERWPEARLMLAGDGSQREALHSEAERMGLRNIQWIGRVAPDRISDLYDEADIYLNSSDIDNMPTSLIEAFAAGLPVVTTRAGGIPYIVEDEATGMLVDRDDDEALAGAAMRLLEEPDFAAALARRARAKCEALYTWNAVRDRWIALYTGVAGRAAACPQGPRRSIGRSPAATPE